MSAGRVEQKFFVAPSRIGAALALLRRTCRWDRDYPQEQINSLYFDTADLDQHERSLAGDFAKDKVRIRWYGTEHDETARVWLELKSRRGFASTKQREALDVPAGLVALEALPRGIVPASVLLQTMAGFGFFSAKRLQPVIVVSYWRYRFVEPRKGLRVALDAHIRSTMVMPGAGLGERNLELPGAVVEVKSSSIDLPYSLRNVEELGSSWTRYSKYSSSLQAHAGELGSVSRLWPSGTMYAEPSSAVPEPNREVATCGSN
ncbi:MAG: hypothetical protein A2133_10165 [Actinobacteria bacterium RBG_16_64_13]|nr:MAG: hypothetical protein A2133_10165 [Actinobacteria bacterium RBG_16_64_13]